MSSDNGEDRLNEDRWASAIAHAEAILQQYKDLPNAQEYSWVIWSIDNWLYLAEVWKHTVIKVLEELEAVSFDLIKFRDRRTSGPLGKGGRQVINE